MNQRIFRGILSYIEAIFLKVGFCIAWLDCQRVGVHWLPIGFGPVGSSKSTWFHHIPPICWLLLPLVCPGETSYHKHSQTIKFRVRFEQTHLPLAMVSVVGSGGPLSPCWASGAKSWAWSVIPWVCLKIMYPTVPHSIHWPFFINDDVPMFLLFPIKKWWN